MCFTQPAAAAAAAAAAIAAASVRDTKNPWIAPPIWVCVTTTLFDHSLVHFLTLAGHRWQGPIKTAVLGDWLHTLPGLFPRTCRPPPKSIRQRNRTAFMWSTPFLCS
jgi:hypothetical protein